MDHSLNTSRLLTISGLLFWMGCCAMADERVLTDAFSEDVERLGRLLDSPVAERRVEGIQGLSHLKHWPAEGALLGLLNDESRAVRREAVLALGRIGTPQTIPHFIRLLDEPWWELRQNAWLGLRRMTAETFPADSQPWRQWWNGGTTGEKEDALLRVLTVTANSARTTEPARNDILRALRHCASPAAEETLLTFLEAPHHPPLSEVERSFIVETLERIGTPRAIPALTRQRTPAAAWALGRIGGEASEKALLAFPKNLAVWLNLDRLKSTNAGPFVPELVRGFGLVTYRSQPDDLHMDTPQPIQRVAANLIVRSGEAPRLIELTLRELEATMEPPVSPVSTVEIPPAWAPMLERLREELKPGFVRNDSQTTSQPLTAIYHIAEDTALTPRLIPLLRHPAFVPRIYIGMLLAKLRAPEALPAILEVIQEGYPFSDATAMVSGKHFDQSQTVRWRGFLCMALGRMGTEDARRALEVLASDSNAFRDIRYSAVVGLGFIGSPQSLPILGQVAGEDIIWMVRDTARQVATDIRVLQEEGGR